MGAKQFMIFFKKELWVSIFASVPGSVFVHFSRVFQKVSFKSFTDTL